MGKIGRHRLLTLLAMSMVMLALVACGGNEEAITDAPTATAAGEPSSAVSPTADIASGTPAATTPTATPSAEPPTTSRVSLDEYLGTVCGGQSEVSDWEQGDSLRELSAGLGFVSEQMSALEPPAKSPNGMLRRLHLPVPSRRQ